MRRPSIGRKTLREPQIGHWQNNFWQIEMRVLQANLWAPLILLPKRTLGGRPVCATITRESVTEPQFDLDNSNCTGLDVQRWFKDLKG